MVPSFLQAAKDRGWEIDTIGGLLEKNAILGLMDGNHGNLYPRSEEFADSGVPYVSATNFLNNRVNYTRVKHLPEERAAKLKKGIARHGDVLFAHNATVGPVALLETSLPRVILSTSVTYHRCNPEFLHNEFWLAYLESPFFQRQVERIMRQTTRSQVPITAQKELWATLPPLTEQRKIADILSTWDAAIEKTEALLANARAQKHALMQSLLTGKRRFPKFEGQPWKEVRLGEMGKTVSGGTPDSKIAAYWDGDIEWATPTDITKLNSRHIHGTARRISAEGLKKSSAKLVDKGALLICTRATIGDLAIATGPICTNQGFKNLVLFKHYDPDFVFYLLQFFKNELVRYASGSTFLELSKRDFEKRIFNVPALPEQKRIAAVLNDVERQIADHSQGITKLRTEKKALMQQLLTGKRRVKV